jgi:hypothetical protein
VVLSLLASEIHITIIPFRRRPIDAYLLVQSLNPVLICFLQFVRSEQTEYVINLPMQLVDRLELLAFELHFQIAE